MSRTLIECDDPKMLCAFEHAALFFTGAAVTPDPDGRWLLIEDDSDFADQVYVLTEDGLRLRGETVKEMK